MAAPQTDPSPKPFLPSKAYGRRARRARSPCARSRALPPLPHHPEHADRARLRGGRGEPHLHGEARRHSALRAGLRSAGRRWPRPSCSSSVRTASPSPSASSRARSGSCFTIFAFRRWRWRCCCSVSRGSGPYRRRPGLARARRPDRARNTLSVGRRVKDRTSSRLANHSACQLAIPSLTVMNSADPVRSAAMSSPPRRWRKRGRAARRSRGQARRAP